MKRLAEITLDDLLDHPIWKQSLRAKVIEANEGMVSPARLKNVEQNDLCFVRCTFDLADGSRSLGYAFPMPSDIHPQERVGYMTPALVTPAGRVPLWLGQRLWVDGRGRTQGNHPTRAELDDFYRQLGRTAQQLFPLTFRSDVELPPLKIAEATVTGFGYSASTSDMPPEGYSKYGSETYWLT